MRKAKAPLPRENPHTRKVMIRLPQAERPMPKAISLRLQEALPMRKGSVPSPPETLPMHKAIRH
ncbi:hypothetical protein D3C73_1252440 [compost metagenome]